MIKDKKASVKRFDFSLKPTMREVICNESSNALHAIASPRNMLHNGGKIMLIAQ